MRTTPLIGTKLWFGPRRLGWGWTPVSWEGWAALAILVGVVLGASPFSHDHPLGYQLLVLADTVILLVLCALKGTPPGGPTAYANYVHARDVRRRRGSGS